MASIIERDFRNLDLNLLLVFHALVEERSVTRAARRLFVGQPAVSGALKRLREALGDELFVRTSHGMEPTPRARELARSITPLLLSLQEAIQARPSFDPATSERVFRVGLSDSLEVALVPELLRRLAEAAPGVRLIARAASGETAAALIDAGEVELVIGVLREGPAWQRRRPLFSWSFVAVFDPRQVEVRGRRLTLAQYLRYPHVLTSFHAELTGFIDEQLAHLGHERRVIFASTHFATTPLIVRQMAAITTVPTFIAATWREALGLRVSVLPFAVPAYQVSLLWAAAHDRDPGLAWLLEFLARTFTGKTFA